MRSLLALALVACGNPSAAPDAATGDAEADVDAEVDAGPPMWESVEEISNDGAVIVERVSYRSDGFRVFARICRPAGSGAYPLSIYNHGGFYGLDLDPMTARCRLTAEFGYVWMGSSYRGEDGSEGSIEVCLGEVTDVLEMLDIAVAQPYVDPARVVMWGGSHGGCITLRALQRNAQVRAAVAVFPPGDFARVHADWTARIAANDPQAGALMQLKTVVETATGGTPATVPAAYAARSPESFVADLPASVPLLVTHGADDEFVQLTESCSFAAAASLTSYHLDGSQDLVTTAPAACASSGLTWTGAPYPRPGWTGSRYFVAYDGLGHEVPDDDPGNALQSDIATFLMAKLQ